MVIHKKQSRHLPGVCPHAPRALLLHLALYAGQEFGNRLNNYSRSEIRLIHKRAEMFDIAGQQVGCFAFERREEDDAVLRRKGKRT